MPDWKPPTVAAAAARLGLDESAIRYRKSRGWCTTAVWLMPSRLRRLVGISKAEQASRNRASARLRRQAQWQEGRGCSPHNPPKTHPWRTGFKFGRGY